MRVSLGWLAELVELPSVDALARGLTFAGLEVERQERLFDGLDGVVVAQLLRRDPHPQADRLSVVEVDLGGERLQIVCGAQNYKVGDKVPLARVGTVLPDGKRIEAAALRGVQSFGMLCSERELGVSDSHEGLWILPPELPLGGPVAVAMGLCDTVFEVNVTPNRADCLSHLGLAREVSAIFHHPLKPPPPLGSRESGPASPPAPRLEATERCGRYLGQAVASGSPLDRPSPPWLRARLSACGLRPIGLAVDVTNYVLLELGQPLHAFALDQIQAGIVVRLALEGERLTTLDGLERNLTADDLVICAGPRPVALAGVMGGAESSVAAGTRALYLEAAWFEPEGIRRTARRHGLHSESSHRFERGVDPELQARALGRAVALLAETAPDLTVARAQAAEGKRPGRRVVALRPEKVGALLGDEVPATESRDLLVSLGLVEESTGRFQIPSHRFDLELEVDLIEEVARLRGFDRIPETLPARGLPPPGERRHGRALDATREVLSAHGFSEALNFSFIAGAAVAPFTDEARRPVALKNPLKAEQGELRTSLLAGLCQNARLNLARLTQAAGEPPAVRLYEAGIVYRWPSAGERTEGPVHEARQLGLLAYGPRAPVGWASGREPFDLYDLKGVVEAILERLGIASDGTKFERAEIGWLHPRSATAVVLRGGRVGRFGELHPTVAERLELPRGIFVGELDGEALFDAATEPRCAGLPRFPAVLRDLALVVDEGTSGAAISAALREAGGPELEELLLFDVYRGAPLPAGKKSLAFSLRFRAADRTLTDEEVLARHAAMIALARERLGAEPRGQPV